MIYCVHISEMIKKKIEENEEKTLYESQSLKKLVNNTSQKLGGRTRNYHLFMSKTYMEIIRKISSMTIYYELDFSRNVCYDML